MGSDHTGIQCVNISFAFSPTRSIINGVSLTVNTGEFIGVVGANGSGKTTLARLLNGSLIPQAGDIFIDGLSTSGHAPEIKQRVCVLYADAENQLVTPTVYEELIFPLQILNLPAAEVSQRAETALKQFDLDQYRDDHPYSLSLGEQFRLLIAVAWVRQPAYLILDEVLSPLDSVTRHSILAMLHHWRRMHTVTVVLITHRLEDLYNADQIAVLRNGAIVATGTPIEIFDQVVMQPGWGIEVPATYRLHHALRAAGASPYPAIANALPEHLRGRP